MRPSNTPVARSGYSATCFRQHLHGTGSTVSRQRLVTCAVRAAGLSQRTAALRTQAIDVLAVPLGGDRLAAEYLLLQLVSR